MKLSYSFNSKIISIFSLFLGKVTYTGPTMVHEGQAWKIECNDLKKDDLIRWTRNGQTLEPELSSGQLVVLSKAGTSSSTLSASQASDSHDGDYKCTSDSSESFHLMIYSGIYTYMQIHMCVCVCVWYV